MRFAPSFLMVFGLLVLANPVAAQMEVELSGTLEGWNRGDAEVVLLPPRFTPPPFARPDGVPSIGTVSSDGAIAISLPSSVPEEDFVPVVPFLEPGGCPGATVEPEDARFSMVAFGVYDADGSLIGEIFKGSAGAGRGPAPGEYTMLVAYAPSAFELQASCPDSGRRVEERYEYDAVAGWHEVIQTFEEHPDEEGWRIDRWRRAPAPEDAEWVLITPPG